MAKGVTNNPNGRPAGVPNKATAKAREAIAAFVDGNAHRLTEWLDAMANDLTDDDGKVIRAGNPKDAFQCFQSIVEYHIPKLARNDGTQKHEGDVQFTVKWGE